MREDLQQAIKDMIAHLGECIDSKEISGAVHLIDDGSNEIFQFNFTPVITNCPQHNPRVRSIRRN